MKTVLAIAIAMLAACSSRETSSQQQAPVAPPVPAERPTDETIRFPAKNRVSVRIEEPHVLGKGMLPGGNVAEYSAGGQAYRLFLVKARNSEAAAVMLFDLKSTLGAAKYLPSFGGYYGADGVTPVFVFQKGVFVAGIVGLIEKDADLIAREFAAHLN